MPTIKFELENPDYCNGCPYMNFAIQLGKHCYMDFWDGYDYEEWATKQSGINFKINRPQACKEKYGE